MMERVGDILHEIRSKYNSADCVEPFNRRYLLRILFQLVVNSLTYPSFIVSGDLPLIQSVLKELGTSLSNDVVQYIQNGNLPLAHSRDMNSSVVPETPVLSQSKKRSRAKAMLHEEEENDSDQSFVFSVITRYHQADTLWTKNTL